MYALDQAHSSHPSPVLSNGDKVEPLGRTSDATWIRIRVEGSENEGWVFNSDEFVACDGDINLLPVLNP